MPAAAEATPRRGFFGSLFAGRGPAEPVAAGTTDVAPAAATAGELGPECPDPKALALAHRMSCTTYHSCVSTTCLRYLTSLLGPVASYVV